MRVRLVGLRVGRPGRRVGPRDTSPGQEGAPQPCAQGPGVVGAAVHVVVLLPDAVHDAVLPVVAGGAGAAVLGAVGT